MGVEVNIGDFLHFVFIQALYVVCLFQFYCLTRHLFSLQTEFVIFFYCYFCIYLVKNTVHCLYQYNKEEKKNLLFKMEFIPVQAKLTNSGAIYFGDFITY